MGQQEQSRKTYPSELTDAHWAIVGPMLPPATQSTRGGRPREGDMREVLNTIFSLHRSGCQWDMLPHAVLPKRTVEDYVAQWRDAGTWDSLVRALREQLRVPAGREPTPSAVCLESQAVTTTAMGGPARGEDGGQNIPGRQRHLVVETLGWLLAVVMASADLDAGVAAPPLLSHITPHAFPRLVTIFADRKSHNHDLDVWRAEHRAGWRLVVPARPEGTKGLAPLENRWVMARTNAGHGRSRRHRKDSERRVASRTAMIQRSHRHLMLHRLPPCGRPAFHYRQEAA